MDVYSIEKLELEVEAAALIRTADRARLARLNALETELDVLRYGGRQRQRKVASTPAPARRGYKRLSLAPGAPGYEAEQKRLAAEWKRQHAGRGQWFKRWETKGGYTWAG